MKAKCTNGNCGAVHDLGARFFGKLGGAAAGAALGGASKHPVGVVLGALSGMLVGHLIDEYVVPACPSCGAALQILSDVVTV